MIQLYKPIHSLREERAKPFAYIYKFEVSKRLRANIKDPYNIKEYYQENIGVVVNTMAFTALEAVVHLLDQGYAPVRLLNPKQHD